MRNGQRIPNLSPIETIYNGVRFRSRLEARWAVFFDAMKFPWEYEPEVFSLPSGNYLPDFRLTSPRDHAVYWFEVKPMSTPIDSRHVEFRNAGGTLIVARGFDLLGMRSEWTDPEDPEEACVFWAGRGLYFYYNCGGDEADTLRLCERAIAPELWAAYDYAKGYRFWG